MVSEDEFQPLTSDDDDDFLDLPFEEERPKDLPKTKATGIRPAKSESLVEDHIFAPSSI